jgi:hypothetical protein
MSWVLPIGLIVGIAAGVAYPVSRAEEWSFPVSFGVVLGVGLALMDEGARFKADAPSCDVDRAAEHGIERASMDR